MVHAKYGIAGKVDAELKLVVSFSTGKVEPVKYISIYLELHQTIMYHQNFNPLTFKKVAS